MDEWNGEFELVDPREIVVDHRYQREEKENLISAIAANPDWAAFGALSLYRRDSTIVCVDGQQRLRGILSCEDPPKKVPAVIQSKADVKREATTFAAVNITRRAVTAIEKHHALVTAANAMALAIERALTKTGYSISANATTADPNTVQAVSAVYYIFGKLGEEGLVQVLVQARDSWPGDPLGISSHMLRGVCQVIVDQGDTYNRAKVTAALSKSSPALILRKAEELKYDIGGSKQENVRRAIETLCKLKRPS